MNGRSYAPAASPSRKLNWCCGLVPDLRLKLTPEPYALGADGVERPEARYPVRCAGATRYLGQRAVLTSWRGELPGRVPWRRS